MAQLLTALSKSVTSLKHHKLVTRAGIYVFGNTLQQALAFVLIPVYTRFLTPEDYGITGLTIAVGGVLTTILGFGIRGGVARYYYEYKDSPEQLRQFISTNFVFLVLSAGSITLALHFWGDSLWSKLTSGGVPFSPYMRLVLWSSYATILSQVALALYRTRQEAGSYMTAQVVSFSLNLGATILFVVGWRMGAEGQLLGRLIAFASTATVLSVLLLKKWFSPRLRWVHLRSCLMFGLPLVPHLLSGWAINSVDRLLLEPRIPLAELGRYSLGCQLGLAMSILVGSINLAWSPYYYSLMEQSRAPEKRILQAIALYVGAIGGICLVGGLFSTEILLLLTPEQYHAAAVYVPPILFAYLLNGYYFFVVMPLFYYKKTALVPLLTISSALVNVGLNLWWIPHWGAMGSAWATVVSYALTLVAAYFLGRRWQKVSFPLGKYGIANGLIFAGILLATFGASGSVQFGAFVWKSTLLGLFCVIAYLWLIKPHLKPLGLEQTR